MEKQWYVVHTYSGFENKVAEALRQRAKIFGQEEAISQVVIPTEEVVEVRKGQKRTTPRPACRVAWRSCPATTARA